MRLNSILLLALSVCSLLFVGLTGSTRATVPSATSPPYTASSQPVNGTSSTSLQITSPTYGSNITDLSLVPGSNFTVNVVSTYAGNLTDFDITLTFGNPARFTTPITTTVADVSLAPGQFDGTKQPSGCSIILLTEQVTSVLNRVRVSAVVVGGCQVPGTGTLFSVTFTVTDVGEAFIDVIQAQNELKSFLLVGGPTGVETIPNIQISGAVFRNKSGTPPIANLSQVGHLHLIGQPVVFNATQSYDPDSQTGPGNGVGQFIWDFGDALFEFSGTADNASVVSHVFMITQTVNGAGYFQVRLFIVDLDDGLFAEQILLVFVNPGLVHNIAVALSLESFLLEQGQPLSFSVQISNRGNIDEIANLTVTYDYQGNTTLAKESDIQLPVEINFRSFNYTLHTDLLPAPRIYTVTATVVIVNATSHTVIPDVYPYDNIAQRSFDLLPRPTITANPTSGTVGTLVTIQGSGFFVPGGVIRIEEIQINFDDMLIGFAFANNGTFSFSFSVPVTQPGTHLIKALDHFIGSEADSSFQVVAASVPTKIDITISPGSIYFPGDTAVISVLTNANGQPTTVTSLQITLIKPDGSNTTLNPTIIAPGVVEAKFGIPASGSPGTYAVAVKAHLQGYLDGLAISSFEVKPTWLQAHRSAILAGTSLLGVVAVLGFYWKKKYSGPIRKTI